MVGSIVWKRGGGNSSDLLFLRCDKIRPRHSIRMTVPLGYLDSMEDKLSIESLIDFWVLVVMEIGRPLDRRMLPLMAMVFGLC